MITRRYLKSLFFSRNKWMMTVVQDHTSKSSEEEESTAPQTWMLIKGAPDVLFPSSSSILDSTEKSIPFDPAHQTRLSQLQHKWRT
jgi:sodium/potassium-transporting ATPase subunit alpha